MAPSGDIVATGAGAAGGKAAEVLVWRISTQEVLARLGGVHRHAVTALKFSPSGRKLLTVGQDKEHTLVVYDWANQSIFATTATGTGRVCDAAWKNEGEFMTVSTNYTQFFKMNGKNVSVKRGSARTNDGILQQDLCCTYAFKGTICLTGNESGELFEWDDNARLRRSHKGHSAAVQQIKEFVVDGKESASVGAEVNT